MTVRPARRLLGALLATVLAAGLVAGTVGQTSATPRAAGPTASPAVASAVEWQLCEDFSRALCATVEVPLDYDDPGGATIPIDAVKLPALLPDQRIGALFVNPGGPGGSAREFAVYGSELLGPTVTTRYDIIGVDPRGVGPHSRMVCRTDEPRPSFRWPFPITELQSRSVWRDGRWRTAACRAEPNAVVSHMSTADTARDMETIRQLLGEPELNYYGISYGTYLGAVYAALFPDRVGRFVVDGVLDPVNWATGDDSNGELPFSTRIRSARGAYEALTSALGECDRVGRSQCALAGNALGKWRTLVSLARRNKLRYYGDAMSYQDLVGITLSGLYDNGDYSFLEFFLWDVYSQGVRGRPATQARGVPLEVLRQRARDVVRAPYAARTVNAADAFTGVACADSQNPTGRRAWWDAGRAQDRQFPWFGSLWTWASAPCGGWNPAAQEDAFLGPFAVTPAHPILVVGNSFDPATPVQGARRFTTLFEGSRFLLRDGWGHGALGTRCVTAIFDAYYASGALPPEGTVCEPDRPLFGGSPLARPRPVERWRPQAG